jgi:membrane-associated protein
VQSATLAVNWLSPQSLIDSFSTLGVIAIIFAETGLLIGIFLPGDSLLVTAGIAAGGHLGSIHLSLPALLIGCPIAAIVGSEVGYVIGRRSGPLLFRRADARLFKPEYVERTAVHMERFGSARAIFLARFVPIVRTVLNPLAGVVRLPVRVFTLWNIISGVLWTTGLLLIGYTVGKAVHNIDHYVLPVVAIVIIVSFVPLLRELRRARADRPPG